jgi:Dimerisation and cyclophilin-binding domain of Mon2/Guanine nucleotide exchange factor in Golgi transport N-terminal/C-terminal region of Mon2 protein
MTAAFLQSELTSLIADSKKRSTEVRTAAERSLADLKSITVTSEIQLAADLAQRSQFVDPFVLACQSQNAKLANTATACLQRLVASQAVAKERLEDVLNGFRDVMNTSYDVQLKILQTLPAVLQLYASEVRGQLLARTLEICANLEGSKTSLVSSSAGATFEQLVEAVFQRARNEVEGHKLHGRKANTEPLVTSSDDASRIFEDLCSILNQSEPSFLHIEQSSTHFLLETVGKVVDNNASYIGSKPYLIEACRNELLPGLTALLNGKHDFRTIALTLRVCYMLLQRLLAQILGDMTSMFKVIIGFLDRDSGPIWRRVLALEFFRQLCSNFGLVMRTFDVTEHADENPIISLMSTIVRIAAEDPSLIGLGRQSTVPVHGARDAQEDEMASIEAQGLGGGLASVNSADVSVTGISLDFSTVSKTLMDEEEATGVPTVPKTYLYALILECLSSFCEGLSKFIMPLSVATKYSDNDDTALDDQAPDEPSDRPVAPKPSRRSAAGHKYQRLANPLKMNALPQLPQVLACSKMINNCWPAILATCSTFLNAALDSHFYHVLIRSMQKLAQVSGTLELGTPRDALLTSLAKGSVPPNAAAMILLSESSTEDQSQEVNGTKSPTLGPQRKEASILRQSLNVRHLLCLRALINLGIALGPTLLQESWFIVVETLQQVETLISIAGTARGITSMGKLERDAAETQVSLASEMSAVNAATKRMFETTRSYSDTSFAAITRALLRMIGEAQVDGNESHKQEIVQSPSTLTSPSIPKRSHHASRSVSGLWAKTKALDVEVRFVLARIKDLARVNLDRFASPSSESCTWGLIVPRLLSIADAGSVKREARLQSASIVNLISIEVMQLLNSELLSGAEIDHLQCRCLEVLAKQVEWHSRNIEGPQQNVALREELDKRVFEALENILGHSGDSFGASWKVAFRILESGVSLGETFSGDRSAGGPQQTPTYTSVTPVAFRCVELICNDFLDCLEPQSLELLIRLLLSFGTQADDLNMSLTTTSLLRTVASVLQSRTESIDILGRNVTQESLASHSNPTAEKSADYLWALTLTQLSQMCHDPRTDVRDASVRILLQVLESTGEQLRARSFEVILDAHLFSMMKRYQNIIAGTTIPDQAFVASLAKLIQGTTSLMTEYTGHLITDPAFGQTWEKLLGVLGEVLAGSIATLQTLVFESLCKLLEAIKEVLEDSSSYVAATLRLWDLYRPSEEETGETLPNLDLLEAHVRLFVRAHAASSMASSSLCSEPDQGAEPVMRSIRAALLTARHPPYTNDIRKRSPEQEAVFEALEILRDDLLRSTPDHYISFLLELVRSMLLVSKNADLHPQTAFSTKKSQKPTYVAMASSCIDLLHVNVCDSTTVKAAWTPTNLQLSLDILSAIINTQYTDRSTNPDAPLSRNATTTAVAILQAACKSQLPMHSTSGAQNAQSPNVNITSCLNSIVGSGSLESRTALVLPETISADETFDITHFRRYHAAAIPILSRSHTTKEERRSYIHALFSASLVAKPSFSDFPFTSPDDITTFPLQDLMKLRRGSVRPPTFPKRTKIPYASLNAVFDLVDPHTPNFEKDLAIEAAPYLLLRVAHPMKTFLADQPLKGLTPLPMLKQEELRFVIERCLALRCDDEAFAKAVRKYAGAGAAGMSVSAPDVGAGGGDGKSHLRILFKLILKTQRGWMGMMKLPDGKGWQDEEVGRGIEEGLERWIESVGEAWGIEG